MVAAFATWTRTQCLCWAPMQPQQGERTQLPGSRRARSLHSILQVGILQEGLHVVMQLHRLVQQPGRREWGLPPASV
jgi:hypothetical protein